MTTLRRIDRKSGYLSAVRPSAAIEDLYRRKLDVLIDEMNSSILYWLSATYRKHEDTIALDEMPTTALKKAMQELARRWQTRFNEAAPALAAYFAKAAHRRSDAVLRRILRKGGISVRFTLTKAQQDILAATIQQNVALIKSIPSQQLTQVEGIVMRGVQAGRDLSIVSKELREQFGVTKRRAALISRDQNNKATAYLQRARQIECGITQGIWMHSGGGKEPRPSHVKAGRDKVKFDLATGWYDPHEKRHVLPGELINCRCVSRPVVPGFS